MDRAEMDTGSQREHAHEHEREHERELGGSEHELGEAAAAMQAQAALRDSGGGSGGGGSGSCGGGSGGGSGSGAGSPLTRKVNRTGRCVSPGGLCIASELASVSLGCSSESDLESGAKLTERDQRQV